VKTEGFIKFRENAKKKSFLTTFSTKCHTKKTLRSTIDNVYSSYIFYIFPTTTILVAPLPLYDYEGGGADLNQYSNQDFYKYRVAAIFPDHFQSFTVTVKNHICS
jgi:hypothetical protein